MRSTQLQLQTNHTLYISHSHGYWMSDVARSRAHTVLGPTIQGVPDPSLVQPFRESLIPMLRPNPQFY